MTQDTATLRVVSLAVALLALAAAALTMAVELRTVDAPTIILADVSLLVVLALLFLLAELWTADLPVRDHVVSVSVVELVSAVALVFAAPGIYVIARALGGALSQLRRTRQPSRILFNTSAFALDAGVTTLVFALVLGDGALTSPRAWVASIIGIAAGQLVTAGSVALVMTLTSARRSVPLTLRTMAIGAPVIAATTVAGTAVAQLVLREGRAWWLLWLLGLSWTLLLPMVGMLGRRYGTLVAFHDHTAELQQVTRPEAALDATTRAIHELLGAPYAEISTKNLDQPRASRRAELGGWENVEVPALELEGERLSERAARQRGLGAHVVEPLRGRSGEVMGHVIAGWHRNRAGARDGGRTLATIARQAEATLRRVEVTQSLHAELMAKAYRNQRHPLTGLPNRISLETFLQEAIRAEPGAVLAIVLVNLDQFRRINASLGHDRGNLILREMAERVIEHAPNGAYVAHVSADEFGLSIPVSDEDEGRLLANVLRRRLASPLEQDGLRLEITTTAGISMYPAHAADPAMLLHHADTALHRAKAEQTGIEIYEPEEADKARRRLQLAADLRPAIAAGEIVPHYQPKIDAVTGAVLGAEALARWTHPTLGNVSPFEFISLAEQTAAIHDLTLSILDQALADLSRWQGDVGLPSVSINVSPSVLSDPGIADYFQALLGRHGIRPEQLVVEFTESNLIESGQAMETIEQFRLLGVQLSIDDYGTGYASMSYLHQLRSSELKIDRSFILRLASEPGFFLIVRSTIELAQNLGMRTVAEGVEDAEAWHKLTALGCDQIQGYLACRPLPGADFEAWMLEVGGRWHPGPIDASSPEAVTLG